VKLDMKTVVKTFSGQPVRNDKGIIVTLGDVCVQALLNPLQGDDKLDSNKRMELFYLAQQIHKQATDSKDSTKILTVEEAALLKSRAKLCFNTLVYGRLVEAIEENLE